MEGKVKPPINIYAVISTAIESGINYGITRAFKHEDYPSQDSLLEHIEREVMNALCEVIDFGDE